MIRIRTGGWALAGLIATLIALTAAAQASAAPASATSHVQSGSSQEVADYWTAKRMRNATPLTVDGPGAGELSAAAPTAGGSPSFVQGMPPGAGGPPEARSGKAPAGAGEASRRATIPFTRIEIANVRAFPNSTHGKIFFREGGRNFVCSGTVVPSVSKSAVITAGHCVHPGAGAGKPWHSNWAFVPGYRLGSRPWGTFTAKKLTSVNGWVSSGSFAYDIGGAVLRPSASGRKVQDVAGARGIAFNQPRQRLYHSFGYPAAPPFGGERLYRCASNYGGADNRSGRPAPMAIGCDMTGGSSGGGWVIGNQFVASVNSYGYNANPRVMFGPYFGAAAKTVYNGIKK